MPLKDSGIDTYLGELRAGARAEGRHVLEVRANTDYAEALQDKDGYTVIDEVHLASTAEESLQAVVDADLPLTSARINQALDHAGASEVNHIRSLTSATTTDGRTRHPGYWADDTGLLSNAIEYEVNP